MQQCNVDCKVYGKKLFILILHTNSKLHKNLKIIERPFTLIKWSPRRHESVQSRLHDAFFTMYEFDL